MPKCYQCDKLAIYVVSDQKIPLCLDCYYKFAQINQQQIEMGERQTNFLLDQMDEIMGFQRSGPRFPVRRPPPTVNVGASTFNNINVSNSTVGVLNTGNIHRIDNALTILKSGAEADLGEAIKGLSQAILSSQIGNKEKDEALEILSVLSAEATSPKAKRRASTMKVLWSRLKEIVGMANDLAQAWSNYSPLIFAAFGS
jgi:hypothetical protein